MEKEIVVVSAEDDNGHALLIQKNIKRAGFANEIIHFENGEEALNFLFNKGDGPHRKEGVRYVLLLDIRMPKVDGIEVLRKIKHDEELKKLPVIMFTTTDDPKEIDLCYIIGCNNYITKPIDYEQFIESIHQLGSFLKIIQIPIINEINKN